MKKGRNLDRSLESNEAKITKKILSKKIILYETIGFGIIAFFLWFDELIDLPHRIFGTTATPINYAESSLETLFIAVLYLFVIILTLQLIKKVNYLEGFLPVCSYCKKIRFKNNWIELEKYIKDYTEAECTNSLCPDCISKHYGVF